MDRTQRVALGSLAAGLAMLTLCGFVRIHDEAVVGGDGGALARRTIGAAGQGSLDSSLDAFADRFMPPVERAQVRRDRRRLRQAVCASLTSAQGGWQRCRYSDSTLIVERRYAAEESPFSSAEIGEVTFALRRWFANGLTRPEFPWMGVASDTEDHGPPRAAIADLRARGYVHDLTIRMPGRIRRQWGQKLRGGGRSTRLDLLEPWPAERETFVVSDADLLHTTWFITLVIAVFMIGMLVMLRRLERR